MKKVSILTSLICALFFVFSSCDSDSNGSSLYAGSQIKDGTKLKITYVVDSAYFTLPSDAPKYHIYGTDTVLPVPVEKNGLPNLMKAKFWSDGTRDGITVLGARNYTKEIHVEYKYSFDTEKCNDGYIMINGECHEKAVCNDNQVYNAEDNTCGGCKEGFVMIGGECREKVVCDANETYNEATNACEPKRNCEEGESRCSVDGEYLMRCVNGEWEANICAENCICIDGACTNK